MKLPIVRQGALALGLALGACSSVPTAPVVKNEAAPATDLDGAIRAAQMQRQSGDFNGATRTLSQIMLVAPDDPRVLAEYGKVLVDKGQTRDALAFLTRAIELQPGDWTFFSAQGVAYTQAGNYAAAQSAFARALQINPGEPAVLNNQALVSLQMGDIDGAERLLLQANPTAPGYARIQKNLALVQDMRGSRRAVVAAPAAPVVQPAQVAEVQDAPVVAAAPAVIAPVPVVQNVTPVVAPIPAPVAIAEPVVAPKVSAPAVNETKPVKVSNFMPRNITPKPVTATPVSAASSAQARFVQISAFFVEDQAVRAAAELSKWDARVFRGLSAGKTVFRVRLGPFAAESEARSSLASVRSGGHPDAILVTDVVEGQVPKAVAAPSAPKAPVSSPTKAPSLRLSQNSGGK